MKTFISIFYLFFLSLFLFTHAHAEKDLNSVLNGTYASTEVWSCSTGFGAFFAFTVAGIISFDGQGNAEARGNASSGVPYECTYSYQVFSDPANCVSEGVALDCDLRYDGQCEVNGDPGALPDQVWYGNIGHRGNGFTGNGNTTEVILIQRQDGVAESVGGGPATCGKIGTLIKINDFPQDLVQE